MSAQTAVWAAQRRGACADAPGSGCRRVLGGFQRRAPLASVIGAFVCPPRPADTGAQPRIAGPFFIFTFTR